MRWRGLRVTQVMMRLQDNRLESGDQETARKLRDINNQEAESHGLLKKVLNVIFITTGVALLVSVIIVIIYTSIGKCRSSAWHRMPPAG